MSATPYSNYSGNRSLLEEMCAAGWHQRGGAAYAVATPGCGPEHALRRLPTHTWSSLEVGSRAVAVVRGTRVVQLLDSENGPVEYVLCCPGPVCA